MKKTCNDACDILVGRHVHPISAVIGGFTKVPSAEELERMHEELIALRPDMEATVALVASLTAPEWGSPRP